MARLSAPHKNLIGGQLLGMMRAQAVTINMPQWIYDDNGLSLLHKDNGRHRFSLDAVLLQYEALLLRKDHTNTNQIREYE